MITDLFLITLTVSFIVDYSGFIPKLSDFLYKKITGFNNVKGWTIPVVNCSLCATFWCCLSYQILHDEQLVYSFAYSSIFAYCTQFITVILWKIKEVVTRLV